MKRVLITGANSYLGINVERWLEKEPENYSVDTLQMRDDSWRDKDFSQYNVVFHVAGIAHADVGNVSNERKQLYYKVNTDLSVEAATKAKEDGVKQFIFISSMIVYSGCKEKLITRDTVPVPLNFYGDSKWQADQKIRALETSEIKVVILRPPMIYGKNCKGNYSELAKLASRLPIFPVFRNKRSMLHVDNFCEFVKLMIDNEESGVFFPQNGEYTVTSEMVKEIARVNGHKIVMIPGLEWAIRLMMKIPGKIGDLAIKAFGDSAYDMEMSAYRENYRVNSLKQSIELTEGQRRTKRVLMLASVASMIDQFNIPNIRLLQSLGYSVDVACNFIQGSTCSAAQIEKLKVLLEEMGVRYYQIDFSRNVFRLDKNYHAYRQVKDLMKKNQYAFVHCHSPIGGVIGRSVARNTKTHAIYTAHGFHFYNGAPKKNWILFYPIEKHYSRYTDVLLTINNEDYKRAVEKFHAKQTVKIPGVGVDTEKFAICKVDTRAKRTELAVNHDDFLILSVGALSESKNQRVVVEALHKMKTEGTLGNIVYLAAGEGDMKDGLAHLISEYGLQDHIKLLGGRTDVDELCETVDCFVQPSICEGLEIALLEAMAAGLPLIAANTNSIMDSVKDGVSGCCVDPADVDAMEAAIARMRDDAGFRNTCGANNWKTARLFDMKNNDEIKKASEGYGHLKSIVIRQKKREDLGLRIDDYVVISVGELNDTKNHQVIIRAIKDIPEAKYVLVGQGKLDAKLKELCHDLGIEKRVIFTGFRTDIRDLLWASDCFAFPSKREGLGIAALEGMTAGLPVIGNDIGGIRDFVVDNETGWLCRNDGDYAVAITKCKNNRVLMARKCLQQALNFDVCRTNSIMRKVYTDYEQ